jgi:hypothetical protein
MTAAVYASLCAFAVVVSVLVGVAGPAQAASKHVAHAAMIAAPARSVVYGPIRFAAVHVAPGAKRVVFSIDGRQRWSTTRPPYRFGKTGLLKLGSGRHVLRVSVYFGQRRVRVTQKTIIVRKKRTHKKHHKTGSKSGTGSGPGGVSGSSNGSGTNGGSGSGASSSTGPVPGAETSSVTNFNRVSYLFSTGMSMQQEAGRYQFMVLAANQYSLVPALKAFNPNLKILMYQSIVQNNDEDYSWMQTVTGCTAYADDVNNHPNWILHDAGGNLVHSADNAHELLLDVGNPDYQRQCAQNAISLAKAHGFDGVFWDEVTGMLPWITDPGVQIPAYPTQSSWVNAMTSALSYLGPTLRAQGLLSIGNMAGAPDTATWEQWVGYLDGVEEESWTDGSLGTLQQVPWFQQKLEELAWTQTHGKYELLHSWNNSESANTYGLAAMLLAAGGTASYCTANTDYTAQENWFPEYTTAESLGAPTGPYTTLANGVMERTFEHGIVVVNGSASTTGTFSLPGRFSGSGLTNVSSVSLAPTSGLILLNS